MTMPVPTPPAAPVRTVELPAPGYPMVTRMISDPLFPPEQSGAREDPVTWAVSQPHPLVPEMKVVRMFIEPGGGVAVYSVSSDGTKGMRNLIGRVRLVEEVMSLDIFIDELDRAEAEAEGDDDDPPQGAPPQNDPPQEQLEAASEPDTPPVALEPPTDEQPDTP